MANIPSRSESQVWSHTRDLTIRTCRRRYYYQYVLARGGFRAAPASTSRVAFALSKLTTLDLVLGLAVHSVAAELATAVLRRMQVPTPDGIRGRLRDALNSAWKYRDVGSYLEHPTRAEMLVEHFYQREVPSRKIQRVREKMEECIGHLSGNPLWSDLSETDPSSVHIFNSPASFAFAGATVWAAPDLIYTARDGTTVILDWKSGRINGQQATDQLGVYAALARHKLGVPLPQSGYRGLIVDLTSGRQVDIVLSDASVAAAAGRVREGIEMMYPPAQAPPANGIATFQMTLRRARCPECPFWGLCEPEIRRPHGEHTSASAA